MTRPDTSAALPAHLHGRKATWFELFFDLVFVVAVARLSGAFSHHYDWAGAAGFTFGFLAMWWCWLGHTFFATRFDEDTPRQRWLGFVQILTVVWIAYGASDLTGARAWVFSSGVAAFKLLLACAYGLCWRWRAARGLLSCYATIYMVQATLWAGSLALPMPTRSLLWTAALLLDLATPWLVARYTHRVPPHPEHLPERFGLFTIILLGEGMAATVHALEHGPLLTAQAVIVALGAALMNFMVWVGYFDRTRAQREREVASDSGGRDLRLWAYAHVPLYLGAAALAAGTVHAAGQVALSRTAQWTFVLGVTSVTIGLTLLGAASTPRHGRRQRGAAVHGAIAALFVCMAAGMNIESPAMLFLAGTGVFALQLAVARRGVAH
jgi:low temperature requirement protein LtrA